MAPFAYAISVTHEGLQRLTQSFRRVIVHDPEDWWSFERAVAAGATIICPRELAAGVNPHPELERWVPCLVEITSPRGEHVGFSPHGQSGGQSAWR